MTTFTSPIPPHQRCEHCTHPIRRTSKRAIHLFNRPYEQAWVCSPRCLQNYNDNLPPKGVGFWKGAGIPRGPRSNRFIECGSCGCYHRDDFEGDCREDSERFPEIPAGGEPS